MSYDVLLQWISEYGYFALFFMLWLGIAGMPIPDEVVVMTGGAVTGSGLLSPVPAFVLTYLGVVSGLSIGYVLGRFVGTPMLERLRRKKKMVRYIEWSERLSEKYGAWGLVISYAFPVVRHVMPYIVGLNGMPFLRYALISYTTGFVWTLVFFLLGRTAGGHVQELGMQIYSYGLQLLWVPVAAGVVYGMVRWIRSRKPQPEQAAAAVPAADSTQAE